MKKFLVVLLLLFALPAFAQSEETEFEGICPTLREYAKLFMSYRQSGADIAKLIENTKKHFDDDKSKAALIAIIYEAYNEPLTMDANQKEVVANEFANKIALICYQERGYNE